MRRRDEEVADDVFFFEVRDPDDAAAAAVLRAERIDRNALDVAADGDRDDGLGVGDDVLDRELALERLDRRTARVGQPLLEVFGLGAHDREHAALAREDVLELGDRLDQLRVLVFDLLAFEPDQRAQPHVDDRVGLDLREPEALGEARARRLDRVAVADDVDDFVDVVERDPEAFEQVLRVLRPCAARSACAG